MALAVAEKFAVEQGEKGSSFVNRYDRLRRCHEGDWSRSRTDSGHSWSTWEDLYTQLARRYEMACDFKDAGSVTILTVTTMQEMMSRIPFPITQDSSQKDSITFMMGTSTRLDRCPG
jgi:hypothetical protein